VQIIDAQIDQATAQLDLVESQLERTKLIAPFGGVVVSGDLSQRLGGLVEQGEVLFEVAPLDSYRVILQVDESRIADVNEGQRGVVVLSSLSDKKFPFMINQITPISTPMEGRNYFRVEAELEDVSGSLRPGMEGVGKISIDRRRLVSIWTRDVREWLRLWVWSWWP
jgi:multidrug efflux pump subunit AcrA (membrane-fusion protein)